MNSPESIVAARLEAVFRQRSDAEKAGQMADYMRGKFRFFGIQKPLRMQLSKPVLTSIKTDAEIDSARLIQLLWQKDEREFQYFGIDYLLLIKKGWRSGIMETFERMILTKSWWDTVDAVAAKLVGTYFTVFPDQKMAFIEKWLASGNLWLIRTALLFQLNYRSHTDSRLLYRIIDQCKESEEFFIRKAIGWALRQLSYYQPEEVAAYVANADLKPLSVREATRRLSR